jgi:penicillin-binding protein 1B
MGANEKIKDNPISVPLGKGKYWRPRNFNNSYKGSLPAYRMLLESRNVMAVRMAQKIGLGELSSLVKNLKINKEGTPYWGSVLSVQSTPLDLARAYLCLANGGRSKPVWLINKIEDKHGKIIYVRPKLKSSPHILSESAVKTTVNIMKDNSVEGTGRRFNNHNIASKTGTSNGSKDCLIASFDDKKTCISWILRDSNKDIAGATSSIAIPVAIDIYKYREEELLEEIEFNPVINNIVKPVLINKEAVKENQTKKPEDYIKMRNGEKMYLPLPE